MPYNTLFIINVSRGRDAHAPRGIRINTSRRVDALRDESFSLLFRLILQYSLLPSPPFSTGGKSVDDKYHTRNCHNGKYHINAHNYFPFFLSPNLSIQGDFAPVLTESLFFVFTHSFLFYSFSASKAHRKSETAKCMAEFLAFCPNMLFIGEIMLL